MVGHVEDEKAEKTPESEEEEREAAWKGEHAAEKASFTVSEALQTLSTSTLSFFRRNSPRELSSWRQTFFIVTCLFRSRSISGHVLPEPIIVLASTDLERSGLGPCHVLSIISAFVDAVCPQSPLIVTGVRFLPINDKELRQVQGEKGGAQVQESQPDKVTSNPHSTLVHGLQFTILTSDLSHPLDNTCDKRVRTPK